MNKDIFLKELHSLLSDLSEDESAEAMTYYEEYFMEAGPEKESEVIRELGSPQEVSYKIHEELAEKSPAVIDPENKTQSGNKKGEKKKDMNGWKIACIVLVCILVGPIAIPIVVALGVVVLAVVVSALALLAALVIALIAIVVAIASATVALFLYGITRLFIQPFAAMILIGLSFVALAVFLVSGWALVKFCITVIPAVCKGIGSLLIKLFQKKKA